jgi:hypothetical protein
LERTVVGELSDLAKVHAVRFHDEIERLGRIGRRLCDRDHTAAFAQNGSGACA